MVRSSGSPRRASRRGGWALALAANASLAASACLGGCGGGAQQNCPQTAAAPSGPLSGYAFLSGTWVADGEDGAHTEETWTVPRGTVMPGSSRTDGSDGATRAWELLRIERRGELVYYVAVPVGAVGETAFQAVELGDGRAVFENPTHDYPQRITYELEGPDILRATVSDLDGVNRETWRLHRQPR